MSRIVYKYPLLMDDHQIVSLPEGAQPLTVQVQDEAPCLWVLVDPTAPCTDRRFRIAGTGHPITDDCLAYIATFQLRGGRLVFHVFEETP